MLPELPLSAKQVLSLRESNGRINIWEGSIRSGKTLASLLRWLIFILTAPRGGALVVVARTRDSAARNVFGPLMDPELFGPVAAHVTYTAGAPSGRILGRTVYVLGASDAKAEKVLRGLTVAGAYVDEITVIPEEFFTQLLGRMSVPGAQLFGTTNPDNPAHWLKRKFLDRLAQLADWRRFHFTLADNPSLTRAYVQSISTEFTGLWYRRFILGEWVAAEGAIYDMWDPGVHVVRWELLPPMRRLLAVGVDYGTTNPTAGLCLGLGSDDVLYLTDEWRYDPQQQQSARWTDAQLSTGLRKWMAEPHLMAQPTLRAQVVAVDPAAASFKVQLAEDGVRGLVNADNDVKYGVPLMASLLGQRRLLVSDRCAGFIEEAPAYVWDPKQTAKGLDVPLKVADHSLDGGRYAVVTTESLWRDLVGGRTWSMDEIDPEIAALGLDDY